MHEKQKEKKREALPMNADQRAKKFQRRCTQWQCMIDRGEETKKGKWHYILAQRHHRQRRDVYATLCFYRRGRLHVKTC